MQTSRKKFNLVSLALHSTIAQQVTCHCSANQSVNWSVRCILHWSFWLQLYDGEQVNIIWVQKKKPWHTYPRVLWMITFFLLFWLQMVYFSSNFVTIETKGKVHGIRFNQLEQISYLLLMSMKGYFNNPLSNKSRSNSVFIFPERRAVCLAYTFKFIENIIT